MNCGGAGGWQGGGKSESRDRRSILSGTQVRDDADLDEGVAVERSGQTRNIFQG